MNKKLLNKKEVAELLSISVRSLERLVARGKIKIVKIGGCIRFRSDEVEEVINGERQL